MKLDSPFDELVKLRARISSSENPLTLSESLDPIESVKIELATKGIEVSREEIVKVGPFLTYKGDVLAILYIYDSRSTYDDLISESVDKLAPKFHFTWCGTLDDMEARGRFSRYILSRRKTNRFSVQAKEREPEFIAKYGDIHEMEDVALYACKNCLDAITYRGYQTRGWSSQKKAKAVLSFKIQEFIDENEGTINIIKFHNAIYTDKNVPRIDYTENFPEISRNLRESAQWACSKCSVNMLNKKEGLHTHHRNGMKNDNNLSNLQVLCALCHKNIDQFHKTMHVSEKIETYIIKNRLT